MRSRCLLHRTKLEGFSEHAERDGWTIEAPKGDWEVFRAWKLVRGRKTYAFVYDRIRGDHFTVQGPAVGIAKRFIYRDELREGQP